MCQVWGPRTESDCGNPGDLAAAGLCIQEPGFQGTATCPKKTRECRVLPNTPAANPDLLARKTVGLHSGQEACRSQLPGHSLC